MANHLMCLMSPLSRPVSKRTIRRKSLIAGNKKGPHHKSSTQPNEPVIPCTSDVDLSGLSSSRSPGEKADDFLMSLMRSKESVPNQEHDDDNPQCSNEEIFLKPAAIKRKKCSPRVQKRRTSMPAFLSPGKTLLSRSMHGLDKIHRRRTVTMTTVDMRKLGEAIESQKRKKRRAGGVNKESQLNGPDTSLGIDVSGSSSSPGVDADLFLSGLNKTQDSSRNLEDDEDQHMIDESYLKPIGNQPENLSDCKKLRQPRVRKQRKSLPFVSPGKGLLSPPLRRSSKLNRCSIPMTKLDMNKLQEAIDYSQIRKKNTSGKVIPQNLLCKSPLWNIKERVYTALDKVKQSKELLKKQHGVQEPEIDINKVSPLKQKGNEETIIHPSSFEVLGPSGKTPDLDFNRLDEMYKKRFDPSQVCDESELNVDTVARFLSFQDAQDDSRNPSPPSIQRRAFAGDIIDPESEVSDTTVDEANETIMEKEIRSFFESKKPHSAKDFREGALALDVAPSCIQQGTDNGGSESEVISAGQKMRSQTAPDHDVVVIDEESRYSTSDSHVDIEDLRKLVENTRFSTTDSAGDNEDPQKPAGINQHGKPDNRNPMEDLQKPAEDTPRTSSQGKADSVIALERDNNEQIVPSTRDKLQTLSQICGSQTSKDLAKTATGNDVGESIEVDLGGTLDDSHIPFYHSTPADPPDHPEPYVKEIPNELLSAWEEIKKEKKTFVLFCHKDAAPCILEDFQSCDDIIDAGSLSMRSLNARPTMVVQGMVLGHSTSPIRTSPKKNKKDVANGTKKGKKKEMKRKEKKKKTKKEKQERKKKKEKMTIKEKKKKKENKIKKDKNKKKIKEEKDIETGEANGTKKGKKKEMKRKEKKKKTKKEKQERKKKKEKMTIKEKKKKKENKIKKDKNKKKIKEEKDIETGEARKRNKSRWEHEMKEQSEPLWSDGNVQPSMESDRSMLRCLRETARSTLKQREKGHIHKDKDLETDDPDLMTFVDLLAYPDVFMTTKRDRP